MNILYVLIISIFIDMIFLIFKISNFRKIYNSNKRFIYFIYKDYFINEFIF